MRKGEKLSYKNAPGLFPANGSVSLKNVCYKHMVKMVMAHSYFPKKRGSLICPLCTRDLLKKKALQGEGGK